MEILLVFLLLAFDSCPQEYIVINSGIYSSHKERLIIDEELNVSTKSGDQYLSYIDIGLKECTKASFGVSAFTSTAKRRTQVFDSYGLYIGVDLLEVYGSDNFRLPLKFGYGKSNGEVVDYSELGFHTRISASLTGGISVREIYYHSFEPGDHWGNTVYSVNFTYTFTLK